MSAIKLSLTARDFHAAHAKRKHPKHKTATYKQYRQIVYAFGAVISEELVKVGKIRFPYICWMLNMFKMKKHGTDKRLSKIYKTKVLTFNDHTEGYVCFPEMKTTDEINKKKKFYFFDACRFFKRDLLATAIFADAKIIDNYETRIKQRKKPLI